MIESTQGCGELVPARMGSSLTGRGWGGAEAGMVREAGHEAADLSDERSELACTERDEQVGVAELRLWLNEASSPYGGL
jgi:hypothetical protein